MSDPTRQQRRLLSRVPVRVSRNYSKLPPIPSTARSIDFESSSIQAVDFTRPTGSTVPPVKLTPITLPARDDDPLVITDDEIDHESSPTNANAFWVKLRQHIAEEPVPNPHDRGCQQTPNKVVRVFVSSTFTDFFNEREILIKKVFPELRDEMEPMGLQIIDCDLRWGVRMRFVQTFSLDDLLCDPDISFAERMKRFHELCRCDTHWIEVAWNFPAGHSEIANRDNVPKDSTTEQTILTCLEELDRCFEDNAQPFFIGLISDKYGWVPKISELPTKITERYRWIDGTSITLMEFIHGAFRTRNPNAFFLVRNSENVLKNLPEKYTDKFRDKDELSREQIQALKTHLPDVVPPEHVFNYDCFYNGLDSTSGRERVSIDGLQQFGEKVKEFLSEAIKNWYPESFDRKLYLDSEQEKMTTFLLNKTQFFVDRPDEFSTLLQYVTGQHEDLKLCVSHKHTEGHIPLLAIKGQAGDGKTMLLGKFVLHLEQTMKDKCLLFYHFLDGAFHPNVNVFMYTRLSQLLNKYIEDNNLVSPTTGEPPDTMKENFLHEAVSLLRIPLIIIVDGLDKGDIHHQRKYHDEFPFSHHGALSSDHTYIVVSCETDSRLQQELVMYTRYQLQLKPFTIEQRAAYTEAFFGRFNKTLEPEQKALILNNKGGEHPLYLAYLCENLRQFGDYSLITKRLKAYPQTTDELLDVLLDEVSATIGNQLVVDGFFKLLVIASVGILESDLVIMLDRYINANTDESSRVQVDRMIWSMVRRHLKIFLDTTWIDGHQVVTFRHSTLLQKLQKRYFDDKEKDLRATHGFLAGFYLKQSTLKDYGLRRVPYHYDEAHMLNELISFLRSLESRPVDRLERQAYLRKHRCTRRIPDQDSPASQRAYACNMCATLFRLGPYTMTKSACVICCSAIIGHNTASVGTLKRDARVCNKHGQPGYPRSIKCLICKTIRVNMAGQGEEEERAVVNLKLTEHQTSPFLFLSNKCFHGRFHNYEG